MLSDLDASERLLTGVLAKLKRYRQAALKAAVEGEWPRVPLGSIAVRITSGSRDWAPYYGRGTGTFIMAQNVRSRDAMGVLPEITYWLLWVSTPERGAVLRQAGPASWGPQSRVVEVLNIALTSIDNMMDRGVGRTSSFATPVNPASYSCSVKHRVRDFLSQTFLVLELCTVSETTLLCTSHCSCLSATVSTPWRCA